MDYNDLARYGWSQPFAPQTEEYDEDDDQGLFDAAQKFAVDTTGKDPVRSNLAVSWGHLRDSQPVVGGPRYPVTKGEYANAYNPKRGVIFARSIYGPRTGGLRQNPPVTGSAVVPLSQWSDVTYLEWNYLSLNLPSTRQGLRAIVQSDIGNANTNSLIAKTLSAAGTSLTNYSGRTFSIDVGAELNFFAALLATPNASGTAWLLLQHRAQLGWKQINYIQVYCVFCGDDDEETYMIIGIRAHPAAAAAGGAGGSRRYLDDDNDNELYAALPALLEA
ncbi:hypothetical protein LTR36_005535 [Oleoguttula mirabilis]|uniref:Capsid protein n=1 Tax=Oleoguttula mirabilis TaxID=1507867 RepID=A0AAV9JDM6_9PEZI|nr:hypothetical protein LTR36_005535 [Oleoguttula mirabilis]